MSEPNYWKIPLEKLPSRGAKYPKGAKIEFRCLTVRDLKYMAAMNDDNASEMVDEVLRRCLRLSDLRFEDILRMDRLTLVFYLRSNTFQLSNSYQTEFDCPYCSHRVIQQLQMSDLKVKPITQSKIGSAVVRDKTIHGLYKRMSDPWIRAEDRDAETILNWTDFDKKFTIPSGDLEGEILRLPADEFSKLLHVAEDARCGVMGFADLKCTGCFEQLRVGVDLSDGALFNRVKTTTLIRNAVQVSKFCGLTISDDMPYNEVELTIAVVNDLAEKEAESLKNSRSKRPGGLR